MPCRSDDAQPDYYQGEYQRLEKRNQSLTKMLCEACKCIESGNVGRGAVLSEDLIIWWGEHKEKDRKRLQKEKKAKELAAKKAKILSRLTEEEKKIVGLK